MRRCEPWVMLKFECEQLVYHEPCAAKVFKIALFLAISFDTCQHLLFARFLIAQRAQLSHRLLPVIYLVPFPDGHIRRRQMTRKHQVYRCAILIHILAKRFLIPRR